MQKKKLQLLNKLIPQLNVLADEDLIDRIEECREQLDIAEQDEYFYSSTWRNVVTIRADCK